MIACPKCGASLTGSEEICSCGQWLRRKEADNCHSISSSTENVRNNRESTATILKSYGKLALILPLLLIAIVVGRDLMQKPGNDRELATKITPVEIGKMLETYNSSLPIRVDEFTVLDRVTYGPDSMLQYHYDISESTHSPDEQAILERIRARHIEQYCKSQETAFLREKSLGIAQTYYREKSPVGTVTATLRDCQ